MNTNRIAILTDSCTDVPADFAKKHGIFVVPLIVRFSEGEYRDGVDISAQQVYDRLETEIPKTSLPSGEIISQQLHEIERLGYRHVFIITISSQLSGTFGFMQLVSKSFPLLDCHLIDTKNIGLGAGLTVILAAELVAQGLDVDQIQERLLASVKQTKYSSASLHWNTCVRADASA